MSDRERRIMAIAGDGAREFLQGLVSNDVPGTPGVLRYGALLTPQGKYLCDFFMFHDGETLFVDAPAALFDDLRQRLVMYRLRRKITLDEADLSVRRGTGAPPPGALPDPRHPGLGWRLYGHGTGDDDTTDWTALRVRHCIPEAGVELIPNETLLLEAGFERLNGVDFRKGCYVGQEVTARMKHKTELRKGLTRVGIEGEAPAGTTIMAGEKQAGTLFTQSGNEAMAFLRFDRATGALTADTARIVWPID